MLFAGGERVSDRTKATLDACCNGCGERERADSADTQWPFCNGSSLTPLSFWHSNIYKPKEVALCVEAAFAFGKVVGVE